MSRPTVSLKTRIKTAVALVFLAGLSLVAIGAVALLFLFWSFSSTIPPINDLNANIQPTATTIWSQDGVLLGRLNTENRQPVTLDDMSENLKHATVAIEDHRFYDHRGLDFQGIARAVWADVNHSRMKQGASTLTQQLVRNLPQLGITREKTIGRKLREALIAIRIEQMYSKNEILQLYLNNIYYGTGAYGIEAASETFFGKHASKLSISEAALLAALPKNATLYSPYWNYDKAIDRRNQVLDEMQRYSYITPDQNSTARSEKPKLRPRPKHRGFEFKAPYFATYVLKNLIRQYGADFVYSGLKIETTLNYKMQLLAEQALEKGLAASGSANQGALVSIDPNTGYIRAMVGGRSFHADQFNAVTQGKRQPGSTFKVFDYSAAFDTGSATLYSSFMDQPIPYPRDPKHRVVKNYGGSYSYSSMDCLTAIKHSVNTIAVQVARKTGIQTVIKYAQRMGITSKLAPYLPTALGASAVRPLDLCSAYTVFPAKGARPDPMFVVRITDAEGDVKEENAPNIVTGILKPQTVNQMETALQAVVTSGTGTLARGNSSNGVIEDAHGKTGTTSDNRDAWFAGYTPNLTTVIWVANVHHRGKRTSYSEMPGVTGGVICAPIWHDYMVKALPEQKKFHLGQQATITAASSASSDSGSGGKSGSSHSRKNRTRDMGDTSNNSETYPTEAKPADSAGVGPDNNVGAGVSTPEAPSPEPAPAPLPKPAPPPEEKIAVRLCVDSNELATEWCDATRVVYLTPRERARLHSCRIHHAPPGE